MDTNLSVPVERCKTFSGQAQIQLNGRMIASAPSVALAKTLAVQFLTDAVYATGRIPMVATAGPYTFVQIATAPGESTLHMYKGGKVQCTTNMAAVTQEELQAMADDRLSVD